MYFVASGSSILSGVTTSVLIEGQPYRVSDLAYDATLGVLINKKTSQMITWSNSNSPVIKSYLRGKGEGTNYILGKGASEAINQALKDKNAVLVEVPEWRKGK